MNYCCGQFIHQSKCTNQLVLCAIIDQNGLWRIDDFLPAAHHRQHIEAGPGGQATIETHGFHHRVPPPRTHHKNFKNRVNAHARIPRPIALPASPDRHPSRRPAGCAPRAHTLTPRRRQPHRRLICKCPCPPALVRRLNCADCPSSLKSRRAHCSSVTERMAIYP